MAASGSADLADEPVHDALKMRTARPITQGVSSAASFRFRLERVRALRQRKESLARQELARAVSRLTGSEDRLRQVEEHLELAHTHQRLAIGVGGTGGGTISAADLLARQAFVEHVEAQRTMGIRELERHEADVADRDTQLGRAAREHEILERLKERQRTEHAREAGRREGERLDEIALERFRRSAA
jgi:flagellar protein FliJ